MRVHALGGLCLAVLASGANMGRWAVAAPEPVLITTPADAASFHAAAPFVFEGQTLGVHHSFSTDRDIVLSKPGRITVGPGVEFRLNGSVSSDSAPIVAPLEKLGHGTLALTGANSHTSNTVLREGTLVLAGTSAAGMPLYNLDQQRGTVLQLEAGAQVSNIVRVTAPRAGDTALPGMEDEAHWHVDSGTATFAHNVNMLVPVVKTGEGSLRLTRMVQGDSTLRVAAGALVVDGNVAGQVDIDSGARLEGSGRVSGMHVHSGGMVAPGGRQAAATLQSWGDVVFDPGSVLHVNAYPDGESDLLAVHGTAKLAGDVWAEAGVGEWAEARRYRILSASEGLAGTAFDSVDTNLAFLSPELEYEVGDVYLSLSRNDLGIGDVGDTPDDEDVGDAIDLPDESGPPDDGDPGSPGVPRDPEGPGDDGPGSEGPSGPVDDGGSGEPGGSGGPTDDGEQPGGSEPPGNGPTDSSDPADPSPPSDPPGASDPPDALDPSTDADPPQASTELPPPEPTIADTTPPSQPNPLRDALLSLTRDEARSALRQLSGSWHASVRSFLFEDSRHVREAIFASGAPPVQTVMHDKQQGVASFSNSSVRTWAHTFAATGRRAGSNGIPGDRHDTQGLVLGLDAPFGRDWRLGGVLAAQRAMLRRDEGQARAGIDTLYAGLTAHGRWKGVKLTAALLNAWHRIDSRRHVTAGPLHNVLNATYTGRSLQAMLEIAPALRAAGPFLRHAWVRLQAPAFQESGGPAAHGVEAASSTMNATTLGWRWRHERQFHGRPLWLDAEAGWRHVMGNTRVESTQRFGTGPNALGPMSRRFTSDGLPLTRNAALLNVGLTAAPARNVEISARYSGLYGGGMRSHAAWAQLRWAF